MLYSISIEFSSKESHVTSGWRVVGGGKWEVGQRWCPGHRRASNAKQSSTTIGLRVLLTRHQPNSLDHMLPVMFERAAAPVGALPDSWRADAQRAALGKVSGSLRWKEGSLVGAAAFLGREGWAVSGAAGEEGQQQASAHLCLGGRPHTFSPCVQATSAQIQISHFGTHPQLMCSILYPSD